MGIYGTFTIEDAAAVGEQFRAVCVGNSDMKADLTEGAEYVITIIPRILPMSPLCSFIGNTGKKCAAHLERFEKCNQ